jgi:hypothetical protein
VHGHPRLFMTLVHDEASLHCAQHDSPAHMAGDGVLANHKQNIMGSVNFHFT